MFCVATGRGSNVSILSNEYFLVFPYSCFWKCDAETSCAVDFRLCGHFHLHGCDVHGILSSSSILLSAPEQCVVGDSDTSACSSAETWTQQADNLLKER